MLKIYINRDIFHRLLRDNASAGTNHVNTGTAAEESINDIELDSDPAKAMNNDSDTEDLTMDFVPDSCRFTSMIPITTLDDQNLHAAHYDDSFADEADSASASQQRQVYPMAMYVQKNSRLKIVLLSQNISDELYQFMTVS